MIAYLNGEFLPLAQARISPLDRGFLFGDGVYEVIPILNGLALGLNEHLARLEKSLQGISIPSPHTTEEYKKIISHLVKENGHNQSLYLQITRGTYETRDHRFPEKTHPTIFMTSLALKSMPFETLKQGLTVVTAPDLRWKHCDIKSVSLLSNVLTYHEATSRGAYETIMVLEGHVTEGTSSNVFIVKDNILITPPKTYEILSGITRDIILHIAHKHGFKYQEKMIPVNDLFSADEVWISSSTRGVVPIVKIDNKMIANGHVGGLWEKMYHAYHDEIGEFLTKL